MSSEFVCLLLLLHIVLLNHLSTSATPGVMESHFLLQITSDDWQEIPLLPCQARTNRCTGEVAINESICWDVNTFTTGPKCCPGGLACMAERSHWVSTGQCDFHSRNECKTAMNKRHNANIRSPCFSFPPLGPKSAAHWRNRTANATAAYVPIAATLEDVVSNVYVINTPKRSKHVQQFRQFFQLKHMQNVSSITLDSLPPNDWLSKNKFLLSPHSELYQYENIKSMHRLKLLAAVHLSHRKALQQVVDNNDEYGLIFEDDVSITSSSHSEVVSMVERFMNSVRALSGPPMELGMLGYCFQTHAIENEILTVDADKIDIFKATDPMCTHAYVVSKKGAKTLLALPIVHPIADHQLVRIPSMHHHVIVYTPLCPIFYQREDEDSLIGHESGSFTAWSFGSSMFNSSKTRAMWHSVPADGGPSSLPLSTRMFAQALMPRVFLMGCVRCGADQLAAALSSHPLIVFPNDPQAVLHSDGEVHFFDNATRYAAGLGWYRYRYYEQLSSEPWGVMMKAWESGSRDTLPTIGKKVLMDNTIEYLTAPFALERIVNAYGGRNSDHFQRARYVVIMDDPAAVIVSSAKDIDRALKSATKTSCESTASWWTSSSTSSRVLHNRIHYNCPELLSVGLFAAHLRLALELGYQPHQFHIMFREEMSGSKGQDQLDTLQAFIGVPIVANVTTAMSAALIGSNIPDINRTDDKREGNLRPGEKFLRRYFGPWNCHLKLLLLRHKFPGITKERLDSVTWIKRYRYCPVE